MKFARKIIIMNQKKIMVNHKMMKNNIVYEDTETNDMQNYQEKKFPQGCN